MTIGKPLRNSRVDVFKIGVTDQADLHPSIRDLAKSDIIVAEDLNLSPDSSAEVDVYWTDGSSGKVGSKSDWQQGPFKLFADDEPDFQQFQDGSGVTDQIGEPEDPLLKKSDPDPAVRAAVILAVSKQWPYNLSTVEALKTMGSDTDPKVRTALVAALQKFASTYPQEIIPELISFLEDPDPDVRLFTVGILRDAMMVDGIWVARRIFRKIKSANEEGKVDGIVELGNIARLYLRAARALGVVADRDSSKSIRMMASVASEEVIHGCSVILNIFDKYEKIPSVQIKDAVKLAWGFLASDPSSFKILLELTSSINKTIALHAVLELSKFDANDEIFKALSNAANSPDPDLRIAAIYTISNMYGKNSPEFGIVLEALEDKDPRVRFKAVTILDDVFGPDFITDQLAELIKSEDEGVRIGAIRLAGNARIDAPEILDLLENAYNNDPSENVRAAAKTALDRIDEELLIHRICELGDASRRSRRLIYKSLRDSSEEVIAAAARAIIFLGFVNPRNLPMLLTLARNFRMAEVRSSIVHAFSEMRFVENGVVELFRGALTSDPDVSTRREAALGLGSSNREDRLSLAALWKGLEDYKPSVRRYSILSLSEIEANDPETVRRLRLLLNDPDVEVRLEATKTLTKFGVALVGGDSTMMD